MELGYCGKCRVLGSGPFCGQCGKKTVSSTMQCPHCMEHVSVWLKFCEKCGKPIQEAVKAHLEGR